RSRRTLRALAEVICPRDEAAGIVPDLDAAVEFADRLVFEMPRVLQLAFPLGLLLLEWGAHLMLPSLRGFSALDLARRERYVRMWVRSPFALFRDLIKGVKGLCLMAFYSDP